METFRLSDRIAVMHSGSIMQIGSPEEVMNYPVNETVASFVGIETILGGEVAAKKIGSLVVSVTGKEIEIVGDHEPVTRFILCIRPENIDLVIYPAEQASSRIP